MFFSKRRDVSHASVALQSGSPVGPLKHLVLNLSLDQLLKVEFREGRNDNVRTRQLFCVISMQ